MLSFSLQFGESTLRAFPLMFKTRSSFSVPFPSHSVSPRVRSVSRLSVRSRYCRFNRRRVEGQGITKIWGRRSNLRMKPSVQMEQSNQQVHQYVQGLIVCVLADGLHERHTSLPWSLWRTPSWGTAAGISVAERRRTWRHPEPQRFVRRTGLCWKCRSSSPSPTWRRQREKEQLQFVQSFHFSYKV